MVLFLSCWSRQNKIRITLNEQLPQPRSTNNLRKVWTQTRTTHQRKTAAFEVARIRHLLLAPPHETRIRNLRGLNQMLQNANLP